MHSVALPLRLLRFNSLCGIATVKDRNLYVPSPTLYYPAAIREREARGSDGRARSRKREVPHVAVHAREEHRERRGRDEQQAGTRQPAGRACTAAEQVSARPRLGPRAAVAAAALRGGGAAALRTRAKAPAPQRALTPALPTPPRADRVYARAGGVP